MIHAALRSSLSRRSPSGFSLPEILVIIMILGVIGAVGIQGFFFVVRLARVQSVALEVAGWLEQVRNAAADEVIANNQAGGCVVSFEPSGNYSAGAQIATVDNACTFPETILRVPPGVQQDSVNLNPVGSPVTFTPRGMWIDNARAPGQNFVLTISLNNALPVRCVRLSPVLGTVEIGRPANSASADCANWQTL